MSKWLLSALSWLIPAVLAFIVSLASVFQGFRNRSQNARDAAEAAAKAANTIAPPTVGEVWNRMDALDQRVDAAEAARKESDTKLEKIAVELNEERESSARYRSAAGRYFAKLFAALNGAKLTIPEPDDEDRAILELTLSPKMK